MMRPFNLSRMRSLLLICPVGLLDRLLIFPTPTLLQYSKTRGSLYFSHLVSLFPNYDEEFTFKQPYSEGGSPVSAAVRSETAGSGSSLSNYCSVWMSLTWNQRKIMRQVMRILFEEARCSGCLHLESWHPFGRERGCATPAATESTSRRLNHNA